MRTKEHQKVTPGDTLWCKHPAWKRNVEIKAVQRTGTMGNFPCFLIDAPEGDVWLTHKFFTKPMTVGG